MRTSRTYVVEGMTCDHCVKAVREEVGAIGVVEVKVDLASGGMIVASDGPIDDDAVRAAVEEAGYRLAAS